LRERQGWTKTVEAKNYKNINLKINNMKTILKSKMKVYSMSVVLMAVLLAGVFIQSCSSEFDNPLEQIDNELPFLKVNDKPLASDEFVYYGEIFKCQKGEFKWEKQLSVIINDNDRLKESELALKNYNFVHEISNIYEFEKIVLEEILNESSLFPVYEGNSNIFSLEPLNKISEHDKYESNLKSIISNNVSNKKSNLKEMFIFNSNEWGVVELEWEYKNKKFKSTCIVSDSYGVLYDNLLIYIRFINDGADIKKNIGHKETDIPRLKSGSSESNNGHVEYLLYKYYDEAGALGSCYCHVFAYAEGTWYGGNLIVTTWTPPEAVVSGVTGFYSANAEQHIISTTSNSITFEYALGYAIFGNISISYKGTGAGFQITGATESYSSSSVMSLQ
jgi:hypothetical protein